MNQKIVVAFSGGSYGTYLEWLINILMHGSTPINDPFQNNGNSHNSILGKHLHDMKGWHAYIQGNHRVDTVRLHPKTESDHSVSKNIETILQTTDKVILIYPDRQSELLCVNNGLNKVYKDCHVYNRPSTHVYPNDIYNNFPVDPSTRLDQLPKWIIREHLSYNLFDAWRISQDWFLPDRWSHPGCLILFVNDILHEIENTVEKLQKFLDIQFDRTVQDILPWHQRMLNLQQHINSDATCNQIISSFVNNTDFHWNTLTIAEEAWIQKTLRDRGIELLCHDLNNFPTTTAELKKLTYKLTSIS